jgi:hypothetical protein
MSMLRWRVPMLESAAIAAHPGAQTAPQPTFKSGINLIEGDVYGALVA